MLPDTFWTGVVIAGTAAHIIPHKTMSYSQGVNAILIVQVIGLVLSPVSEVVCFIISPDESSLNVHIVKPNPSLGAIQSMLNIHVFFLIPYGDEVCAVRLACFLSISPILAWLACRIANAIKIWPSRLTYILRRKKKQCLLKMQIGLAIFYENKVWKMLINEKSRSSFVQKSNFWATNYRKPTLKTG